MGDERSKWLNVESNGFLHVIPETDTEPHGTKISDTEYELTATCACKPRVEADGLCIHNSFEDEARIQAALAAPNLQKESN